MSLNLRPGEISMQRFKHPPVRNKINLTDAIQVRAWTRRLDITADALRAVVSKIGDSVATVSKEIDLQRPGRLRPDPIQGTDAESQLPAPV
jgi:hypothetical protein